MSINGNPPEIGGDLSASFDFDESSLGGLDLDSLEEGLEELNFDSLESELKDIAGEGDPLYALKDNIIDNGKPNTFHTSIKDLCKENNINPKEAAELQKEGKIVIGHIAEAVPGEKKRKMHLPPEIKDIVEQYGCDIDGVHLNPDELEVRAWTPEQMARINNVASKAFQNLADAYEAHQNKMESGENALQDKSFKHLKDEKPLVTKDKFPDLAKLKAESERKEKIAEERRDEELAFESKRTQEKKTKDLDDAANERKTFYLLRDERKVEIKKQNDIN